MDCKNLILALFFILFTAGCNDSSPPQPSSEATAPDITPKVQKPKKWFENLSKNSFLVDSFINADLDKKIYANYKFSEIRDYCTWAVNNRLIKKTKTLKKDSSEESFDFYYEIQTRQKYNNINTTVVYLVGGPGDNMIGYEVDSIKELRKKGFNVIVFDPRGTGCNYVQGESYSIDSHHNAIDVAQIISAEKLTDYIIYAHSYGTVYGTHFGKLLDNELSSLPRPKHIVLEGTLGKSWGKATDYIQNSIDIINRFLDNNQHIKSMFEDVGAPPFEIPSYFWKALLYQAADSGLNLQENQILSVLDELGKELQKSQPNTLAYRTQFRSLKYDFDRSKRNYINYFEFTQSEILCSELTKTHLSTDSIFESVQLERGGHLGLDSNAELLNLCTEEQTKKTKFNSSDYQISVPIVYFHGDKDRKTVLEQGLHHFENQKNKDQNNFIITQEAGHEPLSMELKNCVGEIFISLSTGPTTELDKLISDSGQCL